MEKQMGTRYNPKNIEKDIYERWLDRKAFKGVIDENKEPFCMVIPPPNITGQLHMGHALDNTLQDILIRYKRMNGYSTLWQPGTDHAAISTEVKIVNMLAEQGIDKDDIGRDEFMKHAWAWKEKYGSRIIKQLKTLGSSCDWERERFTLDEGLSEAVLETFIKYYEKGLIYRGAKLINWCPKCMTTISDAEVEYEDKSGNMWHIKYPRTDGNGYVEIATTRPETMLGDTAIAVNPDDERYKDLVGKTVILPIMDREIPVIADSYVDKEFGTGCVKITPAHDPNDFEVGLRHNLEQINILNDDGTINKNGGKYEGYDRYDCRKSVVKELEEAGLLVKIEKHDHNVGTHDRCHSVIEPLIKTQWFVNMKPLAGPAIEKIKSGELRFHPNRFSKIYLHWLENIRDWCISRQLWWGHRIPAYYCNDCDNVMVSKTEPCCCNKCERGSIRQDEDSLDTWFSSALWPFSTLGWPENTEHYKYYFPTNALVTGYDIIFFWVVRMVFSSLEFTGKLPFNDVIIHGLVRDAQGRKMSKSLGNGIDPLEEIEKYGADALRFSLIIGNAPGNDIRYIEDKTIKSRNFANKLWNASRFIQMNIKEGEKYTADNLTMADKWILGKTNKIVRNVSENIDKYEFGIAATNIEQFIWEEFCDWYIEMVKTRLYNEADETRNSAMYTLLRVLQDILKLLHPFMPYISEEIFGKLGYDDKLLMVSQWPEFDENMHYDKEEEHVEYIKEAVTRVRTLKAEAGSPYKKTPALVLTNDKGVKEVFEKGADYFNMLSNSSSLEVVERLEGDISDYLSVAIEDAVIYIPLSEIVDVKKEVERLKAEVKRLESEIKRVDSKLSNDGFVSKAPKKVVDEEKEKKVKYESMLEGVLQNLEKFSKL